jgi:ferritin-like metal-binding protein YciE
VPNLQEPLVALLREQLYTEQQLVETIPELISEAQDAELKGDLEHHLEETREHVDRLEQVFKALGESAKPKKSAVLDSLKKTHEELSGKAQGPLRDFIVAASAASTEHHEISVYDAAITVAEALNEKDVAKLLEQNLRQEQEALKKAQTATKKISKDHTPAFTR